MADAYNTSTALADFAMTKVHSAAQLEFTDFTNNSALQVAYDASAMFLPEMSALKIPVMQDTNLQSVTEGTAIERTQYSSTVRTLTLDTKRADIASVVDFVRQTSRAQLWDDLGKLYGAACRKTIDTSLLGLYTNSASDVTNATTANIDEDDILSGKTILDAANCPQDGRWLIITPKQYNALLKIDRFTRNDTVGTGAPIINGSLGKIHGFEVFADPNVVVASGLARNIMGRTGTSIMDSTIAWAAGVLPPMVSGTPYVGDRIRLSFTRNAPYLAEEMTVEMFYGIVCMRPEWIVEIQSQD
jgi:hypothetical protein